MTPIFGLKRTYIPTTLCQVPFASVSFKTRISISISKMLLSSLGLSLRKVLYCFLLYRITIVSSNPVSVLDPGIRISNSALPMIINQTSSNSMNTTNSIGCESPKGTTPIRIDGQKSQFGIHVSSLARGSYTSASC